MESWGHSRSTGWLRHSHGAAGLRDLQGLLQPEFHGHSGSGCACRTAKGKRFPWNLVRVTVVAGSLWGGLISLRWCRSRDRPRAPKGTVEKQQEKSHIAAGNSGEPSVGSLPSLTHLNAIFEEHSSKEGFSQGCVLPFSTLKSIGTGQAKGRSLLIRGKSSCAGQQRLLAATSLIPTALSFLYKVKFSFTPPSLPPKPPGKPTQLFQPCHQALVEGSYGGQ